jgi:palmitoyltransferase ZDHHC9/14/18
MVARDTSPSSTSSTLSNITVQTEKLADVRIMSSASPSISTPPTSLDDEYSTLADITKVEQLGEAFDGPHIPQSLVLAPGTPQADPEAPPSEGRRSFRSSRKSVTTYNVQILAGTAIHTPTKYLEKHHKNVVHGALEAAKAGKDGSTVAGKRRALSSKSKSGSINTEDPVEEQLAAEAAQAARRRTSSRVTDLRKEALRNISGVGQVVANALSDGKTLVQKTLRRSASDGALKSVKVKRSITATEDEDGSNAEEAEEKKEFFKPKSKVWLRQGLYVGQHRDFDPRLSESQNRARKRAKRAHVVDVLPLPMFAADRVMNEDPHHVYKDFKLPFDTYNPLPRKIKVDGWVKLHKSEFLDLVYQNHH